MNNTCPNDERLKSLICEAFDELPGPASARIQQIAERLGRQFPARVNRHVHIRHWLFWLLFGVTATATAWWGGKTMLAYMARPAADVIQQPLSHEAVAADSEPDKENAHHEGPIEKQVDPQQKDSAVIYKRELY